MKLINGSITGTNTKGKLVTMSITSDLLVSLLAERENIDVADVAHVVSKVTLLNEALDKWVDEKLVGFFDQYLKYGLNEPVVSLYPSYFDDVNVDRLLTFILQRGFDATISTCETFIRIRVPKVIQNREVINVHNIGYVVDKVSPKTIATLIKHKPTPVDNWIDNMFTTVWEHKGNESLLLNNTNYPMDISSEEMYDALAARGFIVAKTNIIQDVFDIQVSLPDNETLNKE